MDQKEIINPSPECVIISTRIFHYPTELVYNAWTNPDHLKNWWGPTGFTNTFHEYDLQPGGKWRFIMHGPDGTNYPNESVFIKIIQPTQWVMNHISKPVFQINATFTPKGADTIIVFKMIFDTAETCNKIKSLVIPSNEQNFDRLEAELAKMAPAK